MIQLSDEEWNKFDSNEQEVEEPIESTIELSPDEWDKFESHEPADPDTEAANMMMQAKSLEQVNSQQHAQVYDEAKAAGMDTTTFLNADPQPKKFSKVGTLTSKFMQGDEGNAMYDSAEAFNNLEEQYQIKQRQNFSHKHSFGSTGDNLTSAGKGIREAKLQRKKLEPLRNMFWGNATDEDLITIQQANTEMRFTAQPEGLDEEIIASSAGEIYDMGADFVAGKYGLAAAAAVKLFTPVGRASNIMTAALGAGTLTAIGAEQEMLYYYEELANLKNKAGEKLDNDTARGVAVFYGLTSGMLENIPFLRTAGRALPELGVFGKFTKKQLKDKMLQPSYSAAFKRFGKNIVQGITEEGMTEAIQQLEQDLLTNVTLLAEGGEEVWNKDDFVTLNELRKNTIEAGIEGIKGSVGIHGIAAAGGLRNDIVKASESQDRLDAKREILQSINKEDIKKTGAVGREFTKENIVDATTDGNFTKPEYVEKFFQESGLTDDEVLQVFPETAKALSEAYQANDGREINIPDYELAQFEESQLESANELLMNYRDGVESLTQSEINKLNTEINEALHEEADAPEFQAAYEQYKSVGASHDVAVLLASQWQAKLMVTARKRNLSIEDAAKVMQLDMNLENVQKEEATFNYSRIDSLLDALRTGATPTEREAYGESVMEYLTAEGGLIDEGGELSARDIGRVGRKNLIQKTGITMDEAIERLVEGGYLSGETDQYYHEDVLEAIDNELSGQPMYSEQRSDLGKRELLEEFNYISDTLERMGIDLNEMTNEQVKQAMEAGVLFQDAYHGTHQKDIEQFLTKYIGTGEGAQAYGWGLYFASDEGIAEWYRKSVSQVKTGETEAIDVDGKLYSDAQSLFEGTKLLARKFAYAALQKNGGNVDKSIEYLKKQKEINTEGFSNETAERKAVYYDDAIDAVSGLKGKNVTLKTQGQTYKVDLKPNEDDYLLLDKPLSEQSDNIQNIIKSKGDGWAIAEGLTGGQYYRKITEFHVAAPDANWMVNTGEAQKEASIELLNAGVRGIKYADATTRRKEDQNFNYVIFDDSDVEITGKFYQRGAPSAAQKGSGTTQVQNKKAYMTQARNYQDKFETPASVLDFGAGLGTGTDGMKEVFGEGTTVESLEVNPERWKGETPPTYTSSGQIPEGKTYDLVVNMNVLNVLEKDLRDTVLDEIISVVAEGGRAIIGARGWRNDVNAAKNSRDAGEDKAIWIDKGKHGEVFQKGFDGNELLEYVESRIPEGWTAKKYKISKTGVVIERPEVEPREVFFQKTKSRTERMGDIDHIKDEYPEHYNAIQEEFAVMDNAERSRVEANLDEHKGSSWAMVTYKSMVIRNMMNKGWAGESFEHLTDSKFWSEAGKENPMRFTLFKRFSTGNKEIIETFFDGYDLFSNNAKAETDISGSYVACEPSKSCAGACYAATGTGGGFSNIMKSEATEWLARNMPEKLVDKVSIYSDMPAGKAGFMLRLNERGDLTEEQVNVINKLNDKGIYLQVFSKRPELLSKISKNNWRSLSVDHTNMDVADQNPDLRVALTVTPELTADQVSKVKDRLNVTLPIHGKGKKGKIWTRKELADKYPDAFKEIRKSLCPVEIDGKKIDKSHKFQAIVNNLAKSEYWTCNVCSAIGTKCHRGDSKEEAEQKAKDYYVSVNDIANRLDKKEKAIKSAVGELENLKKLGVIDDGQLAEFIDSINKSADAVSRELDRKPDEEIGVGIYETDTKDEASRRRIRKAVSGVEEKFLQEEGEVKGYYERAPLRDVFKITLTGKADMSTFIHETGHAFLDILIQDAQYDDGAKSDLDILLKKWGIETPDQIQTEHHEDFARMYEAYLWEGKSPSSKLNELFEQFSMFLKAIYTKFSQMNVDLTDDVRGVMGRMLASDAEIRDAEKDSGILPMYENAEQAMQSGMGKEAYDAYRKLYNDTVTKHQEELRKTRIGNYIKQQKAITKERREQAIEQAKSELAEKYNAWNYFRNGKLLVDAELPESEDRHGLIFSGRKLSKQSVQEAFPKIPTDRLRGLYTAQDDGVDASLVSPYFGYNTGIELVEALANLPSYTDAVNIRAEEILFDKYGTTEPELNANDVVHGDATLDFLKAEIKALGMRKGVTEIVKQRARHLIADMRIVDISPIAYQRAERKASNAAARAVANGDKALVASEKQKQLLNHYLYKYATDARKNADKQREYLKQFSKKKTRQRIGLAGEDYMKSIDHILEKIDLKKVSNKFIAQKHNVESYIKSMQEDGAPIPDDLMKKVLKKNYREMTPAEFNAAYEQVKVIHNASRIVGKWLSEQEAMKFEEVKNDVVDSIYASKKSKNITPSQKTKIWNKVVKYMRQVDASLLKFEWFVRWLDGGNIGGKIHSYLFQPFVDAEAKMLDMSMKYTREVDDILKSMSGLNKEHNFMSEQYKKHQLVAIALNLGNEGNKQRLLDGYGWEYQDVIDQLEAVLTKSDWESIQNIWDTIDQLYKPMSDVAQRAEGERPPKVESSSFEVHGKTFKGGYYPAYYDPETTVVGEKQIEVGQTSSAFIKSQVKGSMAQARAEKFTGQIDIDLMRLAGHIEETLFYITHYEAVKNTWRILKHSDVKQALTETWGHEYHQSMTHWLDVIARRGMPEAKPTWLDKAVSHTREATSLAAMGYSLSTMIVQPLGLLSSMHEIGAGEVAKSALKFAASPVSSWRFLNEVSPEFRNMMNLYDRDLKRRMNMEFNRNPALKPYHALKDWAFFHIAGVQKIVNAITYDAAFNKAMRDPDKTEAQARKEAESTVRLTQSMAGNKDMALIQTKDGIKHFVMFYSFFSALYGQGRNLADIPKSRMVGYALYLFVLPSVIDTALRGTCEDKEDEMACYIQQNLLYMAAPIPFGRDVANALLSDYGYSLTPIVNTITKAISAIGMPFNNDDFDSLKFLEYSAPIVKIPTKPIKYIRNNEEADGLQQIIYGIPK